MKRRDIFRRHQGKGWRLERGFIVIVACVVFGSLISCQPATPVPPTSTSAPSAVPPTSTATHIPTRTRTHTRTPSPTSIFSPDAILTRGPYLQSVTTNSVIVVWETDLPSLGKVSYGEAGEYSYRVTGPGVDTHHAITLPGLMPYTLYQYRVESDFAPMSEGATFRTAASPDQTEFTFVAFGDTRTNNQYHQEVVDQIVTVEPDFVLHTGDLVAMGTATHQWRNFFAIERELLSHAPFYPTLGNHEGINPRYFDYFYLPGNEHWYTFEYGNARFVALQVDRFEYHHPGSKQYVWLEEVLASNTQPWLFVYFHLSPYTSVEDENTDDDEGGARETLPQLFGQYGVDVVFSGHSHSYERNEVDGITYIVTAGGGAPMYSQKVQEPTQAAFAGEYHFVLLEVDGNRLKGTAISIAGDVLDEFERRAD